MVCPACGETLELEGYKAGDLVDCEACGAVLRLLSDGTLELVEAPPRGGRGSPLGAYRLWGGGRCGSDLFRRYPGGGVADP
ncbi:MAG: hypothetical protein ACK41R_03200 [Thermus sp.]